MILNENEFVLFCYCKENIKVTRSSRAVTDKTKKSISAAPKKIKYQMHSNPTHFTVL